MSPDIPTTADEEPEGVRPWPLFVVVASSAVIGASLALIWLATRAVMSLGAVVTGGGSIELTSGPPPTWIAALPVAIIALVVAMQTSKGLSDRYDTPSMMVLSWSALFLTLSWNFIDFGLRGGGGAPMLGLLIPGIAFVVMGLGGLYVFFVARKTWMEMDAKKAAETGMPAIRAGYRAYQVATAVSLVAGAAAGWWLFMLFAG